MSSKTELKSAAAVLGLKGSKATFKKYGKGHYSKMGKASAVARRKLGKSK